MAQKWVKHISSSEQFENVLREAGAKLVVVKWTAAWCGPCKMIAPFVADMSEKYRNVVFLHVDVDEVKALAASKGISSMPTFQFIKQNTKVDEFSGADASRLEAKIKQHMTRDDDALGSSITYPTGMADIMDFADKPQITCLNESDDHKIKDCLVRAGTGYLESDVDEQLLITIPFNSAVRVHSLQILAAAHAAQAPKSIKVFANRPNLGFDEASSEPATQELSLTPQMVGESLPLIPLKFVKFQNVTSITLFVEDNQGGEETTVIEYIGVIGQPRDQMNVNEIKKIGPDHA